MLLMHTKNIKKDNFLQGVSYRDPRLTWTPLNPDIALFRTRHAEQARLTRYTQPRLMRTTIYIPDKSALTNVPVLSGDLCTVEL